MGLAGFAALAFSACSEASTGGTQPVTRYDNEALRPPCDPTTELHVAFAVAEASVAMCTNGSGPGPQDAQHVG